MCNYISVRDDRNTKELKMKGQNFTLIMQCCDVDRDGNVTNKYNYVATDEKNIKKIPGAIGAVEVSTQTPGIKPAEEKTSQVTTSGATRVTTDEEPHEKKQQNNEITKIFKKPLEIIKKTREYVTNLTIYDYANVKAWERLNRNKIVELLDERFNTVRAIVREKNLIGKIRQYKNKYLRPNSSAMRGISLAGSLRDVCNATFILLREARELFDILTTRYDNFLKTFAETEKSDLCHLVPLIQGVYDDLIIAYRASVTLKRGSYMYAVDWFAKKGDDLNRLDIKKLMKEQQEETETEDAKQSENTTAIKDAEQKQTTTAIITDGDGNPLPFKSKEEYKANTSKALGLSQDELNYLNKKIIRTKFNCLSQINKETLKKIKLTEIIKSINTKHFELTNRYNCYKQINDFLSKYKNVQNNGQKIQTKTEAIHFLKDINATNLALSTLQKNKERKVA